MVSDNAVPSPDAAIWIFTSKPEETLTVQGCAVPKWKPSLAGRMVSLGAVRNVPKSEYSGYSAWLWTGKSYTLVSGSLEQGCAYWLLGTEK